MAPMCIYSCRVSNRDGSCDRFELGDFHEEEAALRAARSALLVSLSGREVEVWREDLMIRRFGREVAQFRSRTHPFAHARPG